MGVLRVWHISKFWNSFLMKNPFNETRWLNLHWYYCRDLGRNLLRRITSMPVSFSNLIWSNLNLLKSTKLIDVWRSHLGVNGMLLSGEGIFHHFSHVLELDQHSFKQKPQLQTFSCGTLWRQGRAPDARGWWAKLWLVKQSSLCEQCRAIHSHEEYEQI